MKAIDVSTFLSLVPNGVLGLVEVGNIHLVVKGCTMCTKHFFVHFVKHFPCLTRIGGFLCMQTKHGQHQHQAQHQFCLHHFLL